MKYLFPISFLLALSTSVIAQVSLTAPTSGLRHGDFLCRVEVPYASEGQRGEESVWMLPEIPDDSPDSFQSILSNGDTIVIYEEGRMQHFLVHGDTLYNKGVQSRRAYKIYSCERPELTYPFVYSDSLAGCYRGDCLYEGIRYSVSGSGYTVADGQGILTDGEDTLRHVIRLHLHDEFIDDYGDGVIEQKTTDCYRWYCMGYRYPVLETVVTYRQEGTEQTQISSANYLYLPVMQMELEEDVPNEALLSKDQKIEDVEAPAKVWTLEGNTFKAHAVEIGTTNGMVTEKTKAWQAVLNPSMPTFRPMVNPLPSTILLVLHPTSPSMRVTSWATCSAPLITRTEKLANGRNV